MPLFFTKKGQKEKKENSSPTIAYFENIFLFLNKNID